MRLMRPDPLAFLGAELDSLKQLGLFRQLRILEGEQSHKTTFDHRQVVNLSSNNYLGLTTHPRLRERALDAVRQFGAGSGSVRSIAGTMDIHMELERRLAAFKQTEAVVVFQSGFAANAGTVAAGLGGAKAVAIGFGILLHLRRVHNVVALLTVIYFTIAVLPWTALFLLH